MQRNRYGELDPNSFSWITQWIPLAFTALVFEDRWIWHRDRYLSLNDLQKKEPVTCLSKEAMPSRPYRKLHSLLIVSVAHNLEVQFSLELEILSFPVVCWHWELCGCIWNSYKLIFLRWAWWCMCVISAPRRLRQEDLGFMALLGYIGVDQPWLCEEILSQKPKSTNQNQTFQITFFSFIFLISPLYYHHYC